MALTDLTRISTSGIATGTSLSGAILHGDAHFRGDQVGINSAVFDSSENELNFKDNVKLNFGDNKDLTIQHNGSNSYVTNDTGSIIITSNENDEDVVIKSDDGSGGITQYFRADGSTGESLLYNYGNEKLRTTSTGAIVTGVLTATTFSGGVIGGGGINVGVVTCTELDLNGNGDVSGNFVIGGNLTVNGTTSTIDTNLIGVDRVEVGANSNSIVGVAITQSGTADIINLFDGGTEVLTVTDGGKIGIGVTNPDHNLHAYQSAGDAVVTIESQGNNNHAALEFIRTSSGGDSKGAGSIYVTGDTSASEARMHFGVGHNISHGQLPRMTIMGNGEVGIGTINPNAQVHIEADTPFLRLEDASSGSKRLDLWVENSDGYIGANQSAQDLHFETVGVIRQTIKNDGKIGIGVSTPEEVLDLGNALQINLKVGGRGYLGQGYSTAATILGHSVKAKTTGTVSGGMEVTETNSGGGAPAAIRMQSGTFEFHTAASGTSGATFDSERVRITSDGDLYAGNGAGYAIFDNSTIRPRFQFRQGTGTNRGFALLEERGDANSMALYIAKSRDGNGAGVITSGDQLGTIQFTGADGTNQVTGAQILAWTSGTIAADRIPTNLSVYVHPDSTAGKQERVRIVTSGEIGLGTGNIDPDGNNILIRAASTFQTNKGHIMLTGDSATVGQGPQIVFSESGSGSSYAGGYVGFVRTGGNSVGDLVFGTRDVQGDASTVPGERLRIDSVGKVMIGTTDAGYSTYGDMLTVYKSNHCGITIRTDSTKWGALWFADSTSGDGRYIGGVDYSHTDDFMRLTTGGTERVRIQGTGTISQLKLYNYANTNASATCEIQANHDVRDSAKIVFGRENADDWSASHNAQYSFLSFHTRAGNGGLTEKVRISSGGVLSIGGLSPTIAATYGIEISNAATTEIRLKNTSGGNASGDGFAIQKWSNGNNYIYDYDSNNILFGTTNVSRAQMTKEGRWIISPDGTVINGSNTAFSLNIVQAGNYTYGGSATGTYPGIHIKSTTTGGGNGVAMWTPDNNWGLYSSAGSKTGLAIAPNTNAASSADTRFFLTQDGHMATGRDTYNQIDNAAKCMASASVAGGGLSMGGHNLQNAAGKDHRRVLNWYTVSESTGDVYHHLVTSLWGGGSPSGNIAHIMGGFTIKGYSYGGTHSGISNNNGLSNEDIFFHNWSASMHGFERYYYGSGWDPGNTAYVNSSGWVTLRLKAGRYVGYNIDLYQFPVYDVRDIYVTAHTMSGSTTI